MRFEISKSENSQFEKSQFENSQFENSEFENSEFENSKFENSEFENLEFESEWAFFWAGVRFKNFFWDLPIQTINFGFGSTVLSFCF